MIDCSILASIDCYEQKTGEAKSPKKASPIDRVVIILAYVFNRFAKASKHFGEFFEDRVTPLVLFVLDLTRSLKDLDQRHT
ncbi:MAG: hypothetical protein AB7T49_21055 [Oligoflexales bacterium]